ncbi:hypothetical protein J2S74_001713 [Evansella vedderi]|uniref:Uncharacterized protein n=1 Tax=Evansella vedderi TaxID=38282 RepID=A0ABT9ZSX9_9BACI|nr:hypothetical protein [Evansella vedderi]MDQ0254338.1 hypothetical protein [Evansella vedderi]
MGLEKQWLKTPQGRAFLHEYASSCLDGWNYEEILAEEETWPEEAEALPVESEYPEGKINIKV